MACLVCSAWGADAVCSDCRRSMRPAAPRVLPGGVLVSSAFAHEGAARALVHRLKYDGFSGAATILARGMAGLVPETRCLVPVPRGILRRLRYGVDPAMELTVALSWALGVPWIGALRAAPMGRTHAGRSRSERLLPMFHVRCPVPPGSVLVDDVVTTGVTLIAASRALGPEVTRAVTATGVG